MTDALHPFLKQFRAQDRVAPVADWVNSFRDAAFGRLDSLEVPTAKHEEWRFFKLRPILDATLRPAKLDVELGADALDPWTLEETAKSRLVFVNGRYRPELSSTEALGEGVVAGNLSDVDATTRGLVLETLGHGTSYYANDVFVRLNDAHFVDAACVVVSPDTAIEAPIHVLFVSTSDGQAQDDTAAVFPRAVFVAGRGSKATVIEDHVSLGAGDYFTAPVVELSVGDNARLDHVRLQRDDAAALHVARVGARLGRACHYDSVSVTYGASSSRTDIYMVHDGEEGFGRLDGLALVGERQETDTHTVIDNTRPRCNSHQLHKCIVDDRAHAVFNGKIFVRKGAQLIDAYQLNRNLLLSSKARVDTKPQLEIFADDVQCTHGATIGQLDEDELFYLISRGVTPERARSILTYAFAAEVIDTIKVASLRRVLEEEAFRRTQGKKREE